jgi:hypothetical protein
MKLDEITQDQAVFWDWCLSQGWQPWESDDEQQAILFRGRYELHFQVVRGIGVCSMVITGNEQACKSRLARIDTREDWDRLTAWAGASLNSQRYFGHSFEGLQGWRVLEIADLEPGSRDVYFHVVSEEGEVARFHMYHSQDCCETVELEEVSGGTAEDLLDQVIVEASERTEDDPHPSDTVGMWTFYVIRTNNVTVTLKWYGTSNGYYSIGVTFDRDY